jgi:hypothetical protein
MSIRTGADALGRTWSSPWKLGRAISSMFRPSFRTRKSMQARTGRSNVLCAQRAGTDRREPGHSNDRASGGSSPGLIRPIRADSPFFETLRLSGWLCSATQCGEHRAGRDVVLCRRPARRGVPPHAPHGGRRGRRNSWRPDRIRKLIRRTSSTVSLTVECLSKEVYFGYLARLPVKTNQLLSPASRRSHAPQVLSYWKLRTADLFVPLSFR